MKHHQICGTSFLLLLSAILFAFKVLPGDTTYHSQSLQLLVTGTSTLHDWELRSTNGHCEVTLILDNNDRLTGLSALNFSVPSESLKSGNGTMDNNTYKALKTGSYKNITFVAASATVTPVNATNYQIKTTGKLTIAGTTKETEVAATAQYNPADKSFTVSGTKQMKMTDYGVKPPTVMLGTIKTGNDITIAFTTKLVQ